MEINISELILTIVNFVVLMLLLNKFLYRPLVRFMDERKARIEAGLEEEAKAKRDLDACEDERRKAMSAQNQKAHELVTASKREARAQCAAMYREANAEARDLKLEVKERLAQEKDADYQQIQAIVPELIALLADHMMLDAKDPALNADLEAQRAWAELEEERLQELAKQHLRAKTMIEDTKRLQREKRAAAGGAALKQVYDIPVHIQARMPELVAILTDRILQDETAAAENLAAIQSSVENAQSNPQ